MEPAGRQTALSIKIDAIDKGGIILKITDQVAEFAKSVVESFGCQLWDVEMRTVPITEKHPKRKDKQYKKVCVFPLHITF